MRKFITVICAISISFSDAASKFKRSPNEEEPTETTYDTIVLAQTWPQTTYWKFHDNWPGQSDKPSSSSTSYKSKDGMSWVLHGLWPARSSDNRTIVPAFDAQRFDTHLLNSSLRKQLHIKWPSQHTNQLNKDVWRHQWIKHGACLLDIEETNTMRNFFQKALDLLDRYNAGVIYEMYGIKPGRKYAAHDYLDAIEDHLGVEGRISCAVNNHAKKKEQYIFETIICLDKTFKAQNCMDTVRKTKCDFHIDIMYPKIQELN